MKDAHIEHFNTVINCLQKKMWGDYTPTEKELKIFEPMPEIGGWKFREGAELSEVIVHDEDFHADEIMCLVLFRLIARGVSYKRTRDKKLLEAAELCCDVGEGLLDHHGNRSAGRNSGISACTRVFLAMVNTILEKSWDGTWIVPSAEDEYELSRLWEVVEAVAAWDTGDSSPQNPFPNIHRRSMYTVATDGNMDEAFETALNETWEQVELMIATWEAEFRAIKTAEEEIKTQMSDDVIVFRRPESRKAPAKELIWNSGAKAVYFVSQQGPENWRVLCCADPEQEFSGFCSRKLFPEKYRGLRAEELEKVTGIDGAIFSHKDGFIAAYKTPEAAEAFARLCLKD